jgi:PleD family two-component response regulator
MPDSVIDAALKTDDVLSRAIDDLDLRELLENVDDEDELNQQIEAAVTEAVKDSLVDRLTGLL